MESCLKLEESRVFKTESTGLLADGFQVCVTWASFSVDCQEAALPPSQPQRASQGRLQNSGEVVRRGSSLALASGREKGFPLTQRHNLNNLNDCGQESYPLIPPYLGGGVSIKVGQKADITY